MLLEDEAGVVNVIVPPPVYERCRLAVRTASFALVDGQARAPRGRRSTCSPHRSSALAGRRPAPAPRCATSSRPPSARPGAMRPSRGRRGRRAPACAQLRAAVAPRRAQLRPGAGTCKIGCRTYVLSGAVPSLRQRETRGSSNKQPPPAASSAPSTWRSTSPPSASTASSRSPKRHGPLSDEHCRERPGQRPDGRRSRRLVAGCAIASPRCRGATTAGGHEPRQPGPNDREPPRGRLSVRRNGGDLLSQGRESQVPSALRGLTALFGMGRGVSPSL